MVLISVFICNSASKIIFARQFVEITRKELEEHVVMFNRLLSNDKDSTVIETDKIRYLYIHSEAVFIVLVTSKDSNVIEDIEVLKLSHRFISDVCTGRLVDNIIIENAFEISLGLDDISSLGLFDGVSLSQMKQYLQMDSAEEKEFRKLQQQKEKQANEQLKQKMKEIEKEKQGKTFASIGSDKYDTITLGSGVNTSLSSNSQQNNSSLESEKEENKAGASKKKVGSKSKGLSLGKKKEIESKSFSLI